MKKVFGILLVAVMGFAMVLPAFAEEGQTIYLKGSGNEFNETWNNTFKVSDDVGDDPNVWHLVYTGEKIGKNVTAMQLDFGSNGIWEWDPTTGFSTNNGGNNLGWVIIAPADWQIEYIDKGNNDNESGSYLVTNDMSNPQFNISGFHQGALKPNDPDPDDPRVALELVKYVDGVLFKDWATKLGYNTNDLIDLAYSIDFEVYAVDGDDFTHVGLGDLMPDGSIELYSDEDSSNKFLPGKYAVIEVLKDMAAGIFVNNAGQVGPQYFCLGENGVIGDGVFNNETVNISFTKTKLGGIVDEVASKDEFFFDLYKKVGDEWEMVNDVPFATGPDGVVKANNLVPGEYRFVELADYVWTVEKKFADGICFTVSETGDATWDVNGEEDLIVINVPILGESYGSVTATNEGNRNEILAGLNPKNGNPYYGDNKVKDTPYVVPNNNHFVFAELDITDPDLENGVYLDMMVGNKFDVVGKALVKLVDGNLEIAINGEGVFGAIAFNKLPVFKNGIIHSQKAADLEIFGATTGFNHDNVTTIPCPTPLPCPAGNTIYLYIHCDNIQFYKAILAW